MECIVLVDQNWGIGLGGEQMVYIKEDLKRFKEMTMGKTLVVGRKTLATFPGGKPLPGRSHIILSRTMKTAPPGAQLCAATELLPAMLPADAIVVGGAEVYEALLPLCDTVYVTKVAESFAVDRYFPNLDADSDFVCTEESAPHTEADIGYHYCTYRRRSAVRT